MMSVRPSIVRVKGGWAWRAELREEGKVMNVNGFEPTEFGALVRALGLLRQLSDMAEDVATVKEENEPLFLILSGGAIEQHGNSLRGKTTTA